MCKYAKIKTDDGYLCNKKTTTLKGIDGFGCKPRLIYQYICDVRHEAETKF